MCGLCGEINFDGRDADTGAVRRMADRMAPRGPDGWGVFAQGAMAFGHRRLRIMDLSEHAQQPMFDAELGLGVVFNGAIYNHHELRRELGREGYRFFSSGDTEVVLKAWAAWGEDCVQRFQGMFAFALWERDSGRLVLARDRLGIKPLYYSRRGSRLRFASTLPALLAAGEVDTGIDVQALNHYLHFHSVVPAPMTLLKGVRKLPPATMMVMDAQGNSRERVYWSLGFQRSAEDERCSFEDWQERVLEGLRRAVRRRLVADVPVGALLSGGVDSSLIVGLMAEAGAEHMRTYSVGFEAVNGEQGDEFRYSDLIARHFDTEHEKIRVDGETLLATLPETIRAMSEPMVSHDCVGFYLLSQAVSRHSKVVQSGQGADEVFGGYHWYPALMDSADPLGDYQRAFMDRDAEEYAATVSDPYLGEPHARQFVAERFAAGAATHPVDKALHLDTTVMLVDDPVKRVDNMTMAWGLEARVPFLDHELVELAARIPPRHKVGGEGKYVLKEASRQVIPAEVIDRPKGYFPVPALKFLQGRFLDFAREALEAPAARQRGLFRGDYVDALLRAPQEHITPLRGSKLWQLALVESWLQQQGL